MQICKNSANNTQRVHGEHKDSTQRAQREYAENTQQDSKTVRQQDSKIARQPDSKTAGHQYNKTDKRKNAMTPSMKTVRQSLSSNGRSFRSIASPRDGKSATSVLELAYKAQALYEKL